jgi:hypothetical protein
MINVFIFIFVVCHVGVQCIYYINVYGWRDDKRVALKMLNNIRGKIGGCEC